MCKQCDNWKRLFVVLYGMAREHLTPAQRSWVEGVLYGIAK